MIDARSAPLRILIADAEASARETVAEAIGEVDPTARVDVARNGRELFALLQQRPYDVLVLDMVFPNVDGAKLVEVLALVRARKATRLILLADALRPAWTRVALRLHAYDVLLKPLRPQSVVRTVQSCLAALRPRSLLLVDPSDQARRVVQRIVRESQFSAETTEAGTGRQAIRHTRRHAFDLALVDFRLGDMPALEVACQIMARTREETSVVMMDDGEATPRGLGVFGIRSVLAKPFAPAALDDALHRALGLWRPYLSIALDKALAAGTAAATDPSRRSAA